MTVTEWIDKLLQDTADGNFFFPVEGQEEELDLATDKAVAYGLLKRNRDTYYLTERGHQVVDAGGFDAWKLDNERREREAHQATLDSAKGTVDAAKSAKRSLAAAWVSGGVSLLAFLLSFIQWMDSQKNDEEFIALRSRVSTIDSLLQVRLPVLTPTGAQLKTEESK